MDRVRTGGVLGFVLDTMDRVRTGGVFWFVLGTMDRVRTGLVVYFRLLRSYLSVLFSPAFMLKLCSNVPSEGCLSVS